MLAECAPYAGRLASGGCQSEPSVRSGARAGGARRSTTLALAERYAAQAVAASRERGTPLYLARELVFLAEARRRNGVAAATIKPLVDEAVALADRLGARIVSVDLERYGLPA